MMGNPTVTAIPMTKNETRLLLDLIEKSVIIITNKTTNAVTNRMKNSEWKLITDRFNSVVTSVHRTQQQLRLKWENLKKSARKRNSSVDMNFKNGYGVPEYIPPDDILDRVSALLTSKVECSTIIEEYDGDSEPVQTANSSGSCASNSGEVVDNDDEDTKEVIVEKADDQYEVSSAKSKRDPFTPRVRGFKRRVKPDENRAARNQAIANYYNMKTKVLEANYEKLVLENKRLKLELLEKL